MEGVQIWISCRNSFLSFYLYFFFFVGKKRFDTVNLKGCNPRKRLCWRWLPISRTKPETVFSTCLALCRLRSNAGASLRHVWPSLPLFPNQRSYSYSIFNFPFFKSKSLNHWLPHSLFIVVSRDSPSIASHARSLWEAFFFPLFTRDI